MEGVGQWQREQSGGEEEGISQRGRAEGQMGVPSLGQGWPHTLPLRPCSEAQGVVPWDSLTIGSGLGGC